MGNIITDFPSKDMGCIQDYAPNNSSIFASLSIAVVRILLSSRPATIEGYLLNRCLAKNTENYEGRNYADLRCQDICNKFRKDSFCH
jgi:hypothetical protein